MKRLLFVFLVTLLGTAHTAEIVTQVKTLLPAQVPAAKEMRSMFDGLKPEAITLGLAEATLIGTPVFEALADKSTRVTITWHTIGLTSNAATQQLKSPLTSQFRVSDAVIDPSTAFSARGDLDALSADFQLLKAKTVKGSPRDVVKQTTNNNTENIAQKNAADALQPSGSSGGSSAPASAPFNTNNEGVRTDLITTQWQACAPRIDKTGGKVFAQSRKIDITESGRVMSTGECQDYGTVADIVKEYDQTCQVVVDVANRKVYHQFREYAKLDSKSIDVSLCTVDFNKTDAIQSDLNGCGYRHDFVANKSILQEKLFYNDTSGTIVPVRGCGDSAKAYAHYVTKTSCTPTIDTINKQVFINVRTAFKDDNAAEQYATECRPDGNASFPMLEEFCVPKYEHDFINNVSYYSTKPYYVNGSGAVVYAGACSRSTTASFPHIKAITGCSKRNDDAALKTYFSELKQISTPDDGIVVIAPCTESASPVTYAYTGKVSGAEVVLSTDPYMLQTGKTFAEIAGVPTNDANYEVKTTPNASSCNGTGSWASYSMSFGKPATMFQNVRAVQAFDGTAFYNGEWGTYSSYVNALGFNLRMVKEPRIDRYMRGDGTYYDIPIGGRYWIQMACGGSWQ